MHSAYKTLPTMIVFRASLLLGESRPVPYEDVGAHGSWPPTSPRKGLPGRRNGQTSQWPGRLRRVPPLSPEVDAFASSWPGRSKRGL